MNTTNQDNLYAAIDLGSNSFHLIVAREQNNQLQVIDKIKEMVRLASGIDKAGYLNEERSTIALNCLSIFGQRLKDINPKNIRIVGTNTLRKAKNSSDFISQAEQAVNHEIEVIAGREEARLIYLGVAHAQADTQSRRLVMDIGGGSTEFIIGQGFEPTLTESLHMGCVSMTLKAFKNGKLNEKNFSKAILSAELELRSIKNQYLKYGWTVSTGASGTIKAVGNVLFEQFKNSYRGITPEGLLWLKQEMINQKKIENLSLNGLVEDRAAVFAGGVAILIATFKVLQINLMDVSDSALREGLVYDMLGRNNHEDVRSRTIEHLTKQYHVDTKQAKRIRTTAESLYQLLKYQWPINHIEIEQDIQWATSLHEVGLAIAHNQYHKHGSYIVENSDMPGFSKIEQKRLAILIRSQRRKFPLSDLKVLSVHCYHQIIYQSIILRLAVLFNRGRSNKTLPELKIITESNALKLIFPDNYLKNFPLTHADLKMERKYLKVVDFKLEMQ
jgi:exopolyphosphatase / guanosine-5'-triphosphate,3'-diphosphate pyrophosphatase